MILSKRKIQECDAMQLAVINRELGIAEPIDGRTPFDQVAEDEERDRAEFTSEEASKAKVEAVSALLGFLFKPTNGIVPNALMVTRRIYLLAYSVRPELIQGWSLDEIAKNFDSSRQVFSKQLITQNAKLNLHSRNQKSAKAVSIYKEGTTAWHREQKAVETATKRKEYLSKWRKANDAEIKTYQALYREKNRIRLNEAKRKRTGLTAE